MNEVIKSCHNCAATSGFMCQQCYDMSCWKFDSGRNEEYLRERAEWKAELKDEIRAEERTKFAHELKEVFNVEFPSNYRSTQPFFTLENVRMIVDEVAKEQK